MMPPPAAWLALGALLSSAAAGARLPQNIDENLLNVIKHNLRRNNEDYNERPFTEDGTSPAALRSFHHNILALNEKTDGRNTKKVTSEEHGGKGALNPVQPTPRRLRALFATTATPASSPARVHSAADNKFVQRKRFASTKANKPVPGEGVRPRESPRADILDMAPARGSRINAKRAKGRLCQRHVLLPEGPKYDSNGAVYLQPHSAHRPFPKTRGPRLLLPVCCNCCKKSVLGCE